MKSAPQVMTCHHVGTKCVLPFESFDDNKVLKIVNWIC